jgi:hypothetical protein
MDVLRSLGTVLVPELRSMVAPAFISAAVV